MSRTNPYADPSTNASEKSLTIMAGPTVEGIRFLDLPKELRMMIYPYIFSRSTINADVSFLSLSPIKFMDLDDYHWAITATSKFVREESQPCLFRATTFVIQSDAIDYPFYIINRGTFTDLKKIENIRVCISSPQNDWCEPLEEIIRHFKNLRSLECCISYNRRGLVLAGENNRQATLYMFSPWNPEVSGSPDEDALEKARRVGENPVAFKEATREWMVGRYWHAADLLLQQQSSFKMKMMVLAQYCSSWSEDDNTEQVLWNNIDTELSYWVHYDILFAELTSILADNKRSTLSWFTMGRIYELVASRETRPCIRSMTGSAQECRIMIKWRTCKELSVLTKHLPWRFHCLVLE